MISLPRNPKFPYRAWCPYHRGNARVHQQLRRSIEKDTLSLPAGGVNPYTFVMNLLRLLLILLAIWIVSVLWRSARRKATASPAKPSLEHNVVACAYCDLHVPESEAYRADDRYYCSREHLMAARDTRRGDG